MTEQFKNESMSYKDAGVNIDAGNQLVDRIKQVAKRTHRPEVLGGLGGFGALCELPEGYKQPVLVTGTDGVGTKLRLAMTMNQHNTIGIDLVAMCVNDLLVIGAEPLMFLDYYATGQLNVDMAADVIAGIGQGCEQAGAALVGGETAEMPGMYAGDDYDLAGFCVGVVEKERIIDGSNVIAGDSIIALASSGPHSNGYSLIRKILEVSGTHLDTTIGDTTLANALLEPTKIYVKPIHALLDKIPVHAMSHITGGGLLENIPRVLPDNAKAMLDGQSWTLPPIFQWIQETGNVELTEMHRTFNCGVGMVVILSNRDAAQALELLHSAGENAWIIGHICSRNADEAAIEIR